MTVMVVMMSFPGHNFLLYLCAVISNSQSK